jgi:hypothetical protein
MFERKVLRRIFGFKGGSNRRMENKELHNLCSSPYIIRVI